MTERTMTIVGQQNLLSGVALTITRRIRRADVLRFV